MSKKIDPTDLIGNKYGSIEVIEYIGFDKFNTKNKHHRYRYECECGHTGVRQRKHILRNQLCGCHAANFDPQELININCNKIEITSYVGYDYFGRKTQHHRYLGKCEECGLEKEYTHFSISTNNLVCDCKKKPKPESLVNERVNTLTLTEYLGKGVYKYKCDCGEVGTITKHAIKTKSQICNKCDIINQTFGGLNIVLYKDNLCYLCDCKECGKQIVKTRDQILRKPKSCGCVSRIDVQDLINEIRGTHFVIEYLGHYAHNNNNYKEHQYLVQCNCTHSRRITRSQWLSKDHTFNGCSNCCGGSGFPKKTGAAAFNQKWRHVLNDKQNTLTKEDIISISSKSCFYCDSSPIYNKGYSLYNGSIKSHGIDRIISSKLPYSISNAVSCCTTCNFSKWKWSTQEWFDYLTQVYTNINNPTVHTPQHLTDMQIASLNSARKNELRYLNKRKIKDLEPGILNSLNKFMDKVLQPCYYCGLVGFKIYPKEYRPNATTLQQVRFNGLDRIDSSIGYLENNVVPACFVCNQGRAGNPNTPELPVDDFMKHLDKLANFWLTCKPKLEKYLKS